MNEPVLHGYSLTDLHLTAQLAANTCWLRGCDYLDRFAAAWYAIVEALVTSAEPIDRHTLVAIGQVATRDEVRADMRHRGAHADDLTSGYGVGKNFNRYWWQRNTASPESQVIDAVALRQIWPRLSDRHREDLLLYATTGDLAQAATAAGLDRQAFVLRLNKARRAFRDLWHEGEKPSRMWRQDGKRRPDVAARFADARSAA